MHREIQSGTFFIVLMALAGGLVAGCATRPTPENHFTQQAPVLSNDVDDYVGTEMAKQRIPGLSLAVVRQGKIIKAHGYGSACLELNVPAKPQTLYGLGSISKQFTATCIMLLVEKEHLRLDDKIVDRLDGLPDEWAGVTVRHLLTHTSGIKEEEWKGGIVEFDRHEYQQEDIIKTAFGPLG